MTDEEMKGIACQALNLMRKDIERGRFSALIAGYQSGEGIHRMRKIEKTIVELIGEDWLNSGAKKDAAFGIMAYANKIMPQEAFIFGTAANHFVETKKSLQRTPEERQRMFEGTCHDDHHRMVKEGWLRIEDALVVTVQTETRVCTCTAVNGQPLKVQHFDQEHFEGRLKMYGDVDTSYIEKRFAERMAKEQAG